MITDLIHQYIAKVWILVYIVFRHYSIDLYCPHVEIGPPISVVNYESSMVEVN